MSSLSVQLSNHCIASCSLPPPFSLFPLPFPSDTVRCPAETATAAYLLSSVSEGELLSCVSIDMHVHAQIFWQQRGTKTVDKTIKRFFIFTCIQRKYHIKTNNANNTNYLTINLRTAYCGNMGNNKSKESIFHICLFSYFHIFIFFSCCYACREIFKPLTICWNTVK